MQLGVFTIGDVTRDPTTGRTPTENERIKATVAMARKAEELGMGGLKGHRSVGGLRASIYNAMPLAGCEKLAEFMEAFYKMHK